MRPDFGGHSTEHVLLLNSTGSKSRSIAQAEISFPLGCLNVPNSKNSPATTMPVSSRSSRFAAASASSASSYSPFGIETIPASEETTNTQRFEANSLAGGHGFEPGLTESESSRRVLVCHASSPAPCSCANTRASGSPSLSFQPDICGAKQPTQACSSLVRLLALPGQASSPARRICR